MTKGFRVGYVRVSSFDQNPDRQLEGIELDKKFIDKFTGKVRERPEFDKVYSFVREGDTLIVHSMDRLARNVVHLRQLVKELTERGVVVEFVKENLKFSGQDSPMNNLLLTMMGAVAEFEISILKERQREGIAIAKAKGKYEGRKKRFSKEQEQDLLHMYYLRESITRMAKKYGVSRQTVYCYLRRLKDEAKRRQDNLKNPSPI